MSEAESKAETPKRQPTLFGLEGEETYSLESPEEAVLEWAADQVGNDPAEARAWLRTEPEVEIIGLAPLPVSDAWVEAQAAHLAEALGESFDEEFGDPDPHGDSGLDSGLDASPRLFETAVREALKTAHVWRCETVSTHTYGAADIEAVILDDSPEWLLDDEVDLPDDLNPGIRATCELLNRHGFRTCDSGDGETHDFPCDREYPYVVIQLADPYLLTWEADRLSRLLARLGLREVPGTPNWKPEREGDVFVQASYSPADGAVATICICHIHDRLLPSEAS